MNEKIINTLKDLLNFETYKGNEKEFQKIFNYIEKKTKKELNITKYRFNDNPTIVISNTKEKDLDIIFCTHIDVVPSETYEYHEDTENIYGRGTIDMKGSVAVLLELFNNIDTKKKIALFITSDEEQDGNCVYELLKIYNAKLAIVPDGGTNFNLIKEEKGLLQIKISIQTKSAHSSQPFNGENAITKLIEVYEKLIEKYPLPKSDKEYITSFNLSKLNGGDANNKVPSYAEMILDIRHTSKNSKEEILSYIKTINNNLKIDILLEGNIFQTNIENKEIQKYLNVCEEVLKRKVEIVGCESTSDAIYFSNLNIPTIIMNPVGYFAHCPNEYVNKESLYNLYQIYTKFINEGEKYE